MPKPAPGASGQPVPKITKQRAVKIALARLQKEAFAKDIDAGRMTIHYGKRGPRKKVKVCWTVDFARRGAGEITPGQWAEGYWVIIDPETGAITEASEYER